MDTLSLTFRAQDRLREILATREAREGGIVSRSAADIDRVVGRDAFLAEMRTAGFAVFRAAGQYVIFCAGGEINRTC